MATYNLNVTASVDLLGSDISGSQSTDFAIANPLSGSSYLTFETVRNSDGFYDSSSPKNMAGTYTLGAGLTGVVKSDYIASVVVKPGGGTLTFIPDNYISGSSLNLRGTTSPPAPTGTSFDIDAQAFFTRVTDAGGTLSSTEQTAVNTLVVQMKADGIWTKMKAIYPMVGASAASCAQNLKSSSFTGTFTSGWTFASTGATPNGTSAYMDTGYNPATDFNGDNDVSIGIYQILLSIGNNTGLIGSANSDFNSATYMITRWNTNESFNKVTSNGQEVINTSTFTDGFYTLLRDNPSTFEWYKNSSQIYSAAIASSGRTTNTIYLGAMNASGNTLYGGGENRFGFIGDSLTSTEVSDFYDAVQAFQTTLGRQV